jgi:D-serine deaminase-like pyridoxal phosphate-dependent protein
VERPPTTGESDRERWARLRRAIDGEPLPAAVVDLDAFDRNVERLLAPVAAAGKKVRIASKSIRCPALLRRVADRAGAALAGVMTYAAGETAWLAEEGFGDLLLAYPTVQPSDAALLAAANCRAVAAAVVDDAAQLAPLSQAARAAGTRVPVVVDVDVSWRPLGAALHVGVRRSPLRAVEEIVSLAERIAADPGLRFHGVMGYEAQIAGVTDRGAPWQRLPRRAMKRLSRRDVMHARAEIVHALSERGLAPAVVNGGGTGSLGWSAEESALTEVTAGSGFLCSHLFDRYADLRLEPAHWFALQVVRRPAPGLVTCHGGGLIASGEAGPDRLPLPSLPPGCRLLPLEGAGEVQTPLRVPPEPPLALGDPVFFRHAKAGEPAEHFREYLLVRGDRVEARAPTYRGLGRCFLG